MRAIPQSIQKEQVKLTGKKPVFSLAINDYNRPAKATAVRPNYFNWKCIWKGKHAWVDLWDYWMDHGVGLDTIINYSGSVPFPAGVYPFTGFASSFLNHYAPAICVTKNDTLIIDDPVTGLHRFPNATDGTDFTDWIPAQDTTKEEYNPPSYFPVSYSLVANPIMDEVIKFWVSGGETISYQVSNDDGVTFGGTQTLDVVPVPIMVNPTFVLWVRAAYNYNGHLAVLAITMFGDNGPSRKHVLWIITRENGVWSAWSTGLEIEAAGAEGYCCYPSAGHGPEAGRRASMKSCDLAYQNYGNAGDWMIVYSWEEGSGNVTVKNRWAVRGDGGAIDKGVWFLGGEKGPNISTVYEMINSFSDIQHFSATGMVGASADLRQEASIELPSTQSIVPLYTSANVNVLRDMAAYQSKVDTVATQTYTRRLERVRQSETNRLFNQLYKAGGISVVKDLMGHYQVTKVETIYAYNSLFKIQGGEFLWCVQADDKMYFFALRHDMTVKEAVFYKAYSIEQKYPMTLACSSNYVFAVTNGKLYMSVIPAEWTVPTAGTGIGAACTLPANDRILNIEEDVEGDKQGRCIISLDNHDGYWNEPGSGNLANLKKGSLVSLSMGFKISGTDTVYENRRYFVDDMGYARGRYAHESNRAVFKLTCSDGWKLLDEYIISSQVMYNEFAEEYSTYEIIEKFVNSIGGTVYGADASAEIRTQYPMVDIQPGQPAGSVVRPLLRETGDVIRWYGNDAYIIKAATTDTPVYEYIFPKSS
jgi:hypothetical protein